MLFSAQALAAFDVRRQEVVGKELNRLKEGTNLLNELLSSMNLPAALGTLCSPSLQGTVSPDLLKMVSMGRANWGQMMLDFSTR